MVNVNDVSKDREVRSYLLDTEVEGKQRFPKIGKYYWRKKLVIENLNFIKKKYRWLLYDM